MTTPGTVKAAVLHCLLAAGRPGLTAKALALAVGMDEHGVSSLLTFYKHKGYVHRGPGRPAVWVHKLHAVQQAAPVLTTPVVKPCARGFVASMRQPRASFGTIKRQQSDVPVVVPPGVKITRAPAHQDGRYAVDAATFQGGAFMAEWQRLRAGGKGR